MTLSNSTLAYSRKIMTAVLGLDSLYRQESEDQEGLAVINMDLELEFKPDKFDSYETAARVFNGLKQEAMDLPEEDRQVYYKELCESKLTFIKWRQNGLKINEQLSGFLHVPAAPATDAQINQLKSDMQALLNKMGYTGDLKTQCQKWEEKNRVPSDEIADRANELMEKAWDATEAKLFEIPADKSDMMKIVPITGGAFNARCNYLQRKVELNIDPVITLPGLKHLVVHEGCPGHYVQFKIRETAYKNGDSGADNLISIVNSASSCVFEGIADSGLSMIDWINDDNDRFSALMGQYRAGIGTVSAWRLHALGWSETEVRDALLEESLIGGERWVQNRMRFISAPSRAVLIWSYWWGERTVLPYWNQLDNKHHSGYLQYLYDRMHSNQTISMYKPE